MIALAVNRYRLNRIFRKRRESVIFITWIFDRNGDIWGRQNQSSYIWRIIESYKYVSSRIRIEVAYILSRMELSSGRWKISISNEGPPLALDRRDGPTQTILSQRW